MKVSKYIMNFLGFNALFFLTYSIVTVLIEIGIIKYWAGSTNSGGLAPSNTYGTALIWILVIGLIFFKSNFKFLLGNGVSRRRFFGVAVPALALLAATWALMATLIPVVFKTMGDYLLFHEYLYRKSSMAGGILWTFGALFFTVILGWLISLLYYRSTLRLKVVISIFPLILIPILLFLNKTSGGVIFQALGKFFLTILGFTQSPANPYTGAFSLTLAALFICGCNYLLMRKAEIKD
ncbi:MAG TPA: hypothetical protein VHY08_25075 [Bacillota bacterium]|nr:hypothetical protein [Bacillota bacterium]